MYYRLPYNFYGSVYSKILAFLEGGEGGVKRGKANKTLKKNTRGLYKKEDFSELVVSRIRMT